MKKVILSKVLFFIFGFILFFFISSKFFEKKDKVSDIFFWILMGGFMGITLISFPYFYDHFFHPEKGVRIRTGIIWTMGGYGTALIAWIIM